MSVQLSRPDHLISGTQGYYHRVPITRQRIVGTSECNLLCSPYIFSPTRESYEPLLRERLLCSLGICLLSIAMGWK